MNAKTYLWIFIGILVFGLLILFSYNYKYTSIATHSQFRMLLQNHHKQYLERLHAKDKIYRGLSPYMTTNDLLDHYQSKYRNKGMLSHLILENTVSRLRGIAFINNRKIPWKFAIVSNSTEGGNPFTIHDTIILSTGMVSELFSKWFKNDNDFLQSSIINTIIHERIHILQKYYKQAFEELYTKYWGFYHDVSGVPNNLRGIVRNNPDGLDISWSWGGMRIFCVFRPVGPTKINNTEIVFIDKMNRLGYVRNSPKFMNFFGYNVNYYHPHEISAEIIAQLITKNNRTLTHYPAALKCKQWLRHLLKNL